MNNLTNIVTIKPLTIHDTEVVYHLIDQSRADLKNLIWSQSATLESTKKFIEYKNNTKDKVFGVFQDNSLVGILELREEPLPKGRGF